jgi:hypothetical protein
VNDAPGDIKMRWVAIILFIFGGLLCCINFYLSFIRYTIHRLRGKLKNDYRWTSGYPIIGSGSVALSLFSFWNHQIIFPIAIALILIDTGGIHWFAGTMIYKNIKIQAP